MLSLVVLCFVGRFNLCIWRNVVGFKRIFCWNCIYYVYVILLFISINNFGFFWIKWVVWFVKYGCVFSCKVIIYILKKMLNILWYSLNDY